jgi:SAM-dependent methyltransferase
MGSEFDPYAQSYDRVLSEALGASVDADRFAAYKVEEMAYQLARTHIGRVLDFGCGVGRGLPFLAQAFPGAELWGYEPSAECVRAARQRAPEARTTHVWDEIPTGTFDCVIAANVFHHIPDDQRVDALRRCGAALAPGGSAFVFEHNPLNPLTRRVFERCPFDRDASMIALPRMVALGRRAGLGIRREAFTLFLPFSGKLVGAVHRSLAWLPLGAQYYVQFVR